MYRRDICAKEEMKEIICEKNIHIGIAHQIKEAEAILAEKEIDCSPPCSQVLPQENFPEVVLMAALGIRRCHGCKGPMLKQKLPAPQRFGVPDASSSNMENKGMRSMAKMLWECLFSVTNLMHSVTQP